MSIKTFEERCKISEQCLPDAPYRAMLTKLHEEMLQEIKSLKVYQEPVALGSGKRLIVVDQSFDDLMYWLDRCEYKGHLENCPDLVEPWGAFQYENYPKISGGN